MVDDGDGPLATRYFRRLGLDPDQLDARPTIEKLQAIHEAHLSKIPFENLAQHGCSRPAVLDAQQTALKILDRNRGGFCFELNGLLAELLTELGYGVCRIPAFVYINEVAFAEKATHLVLVVVCQPGTEQESTWFVDVGFGEPSIHPLRYDAFDEEQITTEGMRSKFARKGDDVVLHWFRASDEWVPRLKWNYEDSLLGSNGPALSSFEAALAVVHGSSSIFAQKLIVCLLTRENKLTVAGNRLKVTGPPRFPEQDATPIVRSLESEDEVREILRDDFGIPFEETQGICLGKSIAADPSIWSNQ
jgi:N-hydroxyarylamine O-acetyltransferase